MSIVLALAAIIGGVDTMHGQGPATGAEERIRYSKRREFFIPFATDPKSPIAEIRLFARRNGGEWEYLTSAKPTQVGFNFRSSQDGAYGFTVQTVYKDGATEPARDQLRADLTVIIDTVPPKITLRTCSTLDGGAGVEWDIVDDHIDPSSIRLECRCPGTTDWEPIAKGVQFKPHDQRVWMLEPVQCFEIRVLATDFAKNETTSEPITISGANRANAYSARSNRARICMGRPRCCSAAGR
jgi:hypothetical protein